MKLKINGGYLTINDNSEEAKKIRDGYDFDFENEKLKIKTLSSKIDNKYQAIKVLQNVKNIDIKLKEVFNFILNNL